MWGHDTAIFTLLYLIRITLWFHEIFKLIFPKASSWPAFQSDTVSPGGNSLEIEIPNFHFSKKWKFHGNTRAFTMGFYVPAFSQRKGFTAFLFILCQTHRKPHAHTASLSFMLFPPPPTDAHTHKFLRS